MTWSLPELGAKPKQHSSRAYALPTAPGDNRPPAGFWEQLPGPVLKKNCVQKAEGLWPVLQVLPTALKGQLSALLWPGQATDSWVSQIGKLIRATSSGCMGMELKYVYHALVKWLRVAASPLAP